MRIPSIDIAKGLSILLVVMVHVGIPEPFVGAYAVKVPIFFFLAGLFFLNSANRGQYLVKKCKSILVPFAIYYLISYMLFYLIVSVKHDFIVGNHTFAISDLFTQRNLFNGPLWFLLSLFEVEALFYLIYVFVKKEWLRATIVFIFASVGFYLSATETFLPLWLDTSCVALMYFYFGYIFSLTNLASKPLKPIWLICIAAISYGLFLLMPVSIGMSINYYSNYLLAVSSGSLMILFILVVSRMLSKVTFISWIGTNSLALLCTHHLVYRPIKLIQMKIGIEDPYFLFILTMVIEVGVILLINRYFPILAGKYTCKKS